jgi:hypothetical protein
MGLDTKTDWLTVCRSVTFWVLRRKREEQEVGLRRPPAWELVSWSNELVVRQSPASKDVNTEAEEATVLEAITRRQPVKIQQTEKTRCLLWWISNSAIVACSYELCV